MARALLDINVLIALFDTGHQFHSRARFWLEKHIAEGWASCPITQNGFVRIVSQASYPNRVPPAEAIGRLTEATQSAHHQYWSDDISILSGDLIDATRIHGPKQVTDAYLLALAVKHGGCFVTFDERPPITAVRKATDRHWHIL